MHLQNTNKTSHSRTANCAAHFLICSKLTHIGISQAPPCRGRKASVAGSGRQTEIDAHTKRTNPEHRSQFRRLRSSHTAGGGRVPRLHPLIKVRIMTPVWAGWLWAKKLRAISNDVYHMGMHACEHDVYGWVSSMSANLNNIL